MNKEEFRDLVRKVSDGEASDTEVALYNRYYAAYQQAGEMWDEQEMGDQGRVSARLKQRIHQQIRPAVVIPFWKRHLRMASAAAVLLLLSAGLVFYLNTQRSMEADLASHDVAPGGNKAVLTLGNGTRIALTDALNGELAQESGISVKKTKDGQLVYTVMESSDPGDPAQAGGIYNTVSTPMGGQYQINLPDGTKVWLNAASSLKFPASFANLKERRVELVGEAYFEVSHNKKLPFIVKTEKQDVLVLGTHFNINSYPDEPATRTTLLQGAVLVRRLGSRSEKGNRDFVVIKPGQQCTLGQRIGVEDADVEMVTAWKDGNFLFNDTDLPNIMKQLARWYNVDIDYSNVPADRFFTGFISRDVNLSKVLKMLEETGRIKFKVEHNNIKIINE
ncbi:MAG TPA: FecR domain-containing protein [Pedobacter sp.]|uniref:FecR family protein n=1 Tax=Pedobacter sp. TaxID=1411316 RepID=UPI002BBAB4BC|nr:FecR domain-containing protein [Pedobacter sp.]HMI03141.1 FecR domain-containing protein [Pedobacter sp.]